MTVALLILVALALVLVLATGGGLQTPNRPALDRVRQAQARANTAGMLLLAATVLAALVVAR